MAMATPTDHRTPFTAFRWSVDLASPWAVSGKQQEWPALDASSDPARGRLLMGPDAEGRLAAVRVSVDGDLLRVRASVRRSGRSSADHPEWYNRDHLAVLVDPHHDHATRWLAAVDDRGQVTTEADFVVQGEELSDVGRKPLDPPTQATGTFEEVGADGFHAAVELLLPPEARACQPLGLAVKVGFRDSPLPEPLVWPAAEAWARDTPLVFGDLYREAPAVAVEHLVIDEPAWDREEVRLALRGSWSDGAETGTAAREGSVEVRFELPGDGIVEHPDLAWEADGAVLRVDGPLCFPHRSKWANGLVHIARLHLRLLSPDGSVLWSGSYPYGFDHGLIVRERYGCGGAEPPQRPAPGSPDFVGAFRRYVLGRLPDYTAQTTTSGAPSDFFLTDRSSDHVLDLSRADSLGCAADMIAARFPDWQDALCAAAMWVHHPCISRHSSSWSRVAHSSHVDVLPRLGGCFCGDTARLLACLAERVGERLEVDLRGFSMGLRGHLTTLVATPAGEVVIDGMLGLWFHRLDNERLATLDEMREDRAITERMWYAPRAGGEEFFYRAHDQVIREWREGPPPWSPYI